MKVLIVDNDVENAKLLKRYLISTKSIKSVNALTDRSSNVLKALSKYKIDLIFLDIRFFGSYSFKNVEEIIRVYPKMMFVYYGLIIEKKYIDKCMEKSGVMSIYRPLKLSDVKIAVQLSKKYYAKNIDFFKKEEKISKLVMENQNVYKQKFLQAIVEGKINNSIEILRNFQFYKINLKNNYRVLNIKIDNYKTIILTLDEYEKHMLLCKIIEIVKAKYEEVNILNAVFSVEFNSVVSIISTDIEVEKIMEISKEINELIYEETNVRTTAGIGRCYEKEEEIYISYAESIGALAYRFHIGYNTVILIDFVEPDNNVTYRYSNDKETRLIHAAVLGEYAYCKELLRGLIKSLESVEDIPDKLYPKVIMNIINSISRFAVEQSLDIDDVFMEFFDFKQLLSISSLSETYKFLDGFLIKFCDYILKLHREKDEKLFLKIKDYINNNFENNITTSKIAKDLNTPSAFINKLFKDRENINVYEYILKVKLGEAKRLMEDTNMTDLEISQKLGYTNEEYFKKTFFMYEKIKTKDYRRKQRGF